jgi:hypothetical protein
VVLVVQVEVVMVFQVLEQEPCRISGTANTGGDNVLVLAAQESLL